ncbi:MAG: hypothetical protein KME21_09555 [Desmonostoc vinosum HA7617-LM4]|jgi:hypothetical protein|nr:hypothetical protein [Desmonostoc vinosum HA7617-LM4]
MPNQQQTSNNHQVDKFAEALATARKMQTDWLNYGLDFVHLYFEDVDGDWLENWSNDEIVYSPLLDSLKEFLVSDDDVAVRVRQYLEEQTSITLFDVAVNLEKCWRITKVDNRLSAIKNLLTVDKYNDDTSNEIDDIANNLLKKLLEIS